jgi:hypothetical protein
MEHVVFFPAPDGSPAFRRFAALDDAVPFVEHLRNAEGVSEVSVHALSEVPLAFRAYYKVEVPGEQVGADSALVAPVADPVLDPVLDVPLPSEPVGEVVPADVPAAKVDAPMVEVAAQPSEQPANGKRSLGFFAH